MICQIFTLLDPPKTDILVQFVKVELIGLKSRTQLRFSSNQKFLMNKAGSVHRNAVRQGRGIQKTLRQRQGPNNRTRSYTHETNTGKKAGTLTEN